MRKRRRKRKMGREGGKRRKGMREKRGEALNPEENKGEKKITS